MPTCRLLQWIIQTTSGIISVRYVSLSQPGFVVKPAIAQIKFTEILNHLKFHHNLKWTSGGESMRFLFSFLTATANSSVARD